MLANKVKLLSVTTPGFGAVRCLQTITEQLFEKESCKVLVVGAGCGGCAIASKLSSKLDNGKVILVDPADTHYYQPMFSLIGGGIKRLEQSHRPMADVVPRNAKWIKEKAANFHPKSNTVTLKSGRQINYDVLVIATGLQLNYNKIPGLEEALSIPNGMVSSIYSPKYVNRTYEALQRIQEGNAIFTYPASPVKCPGAPQKIVYLAEHFFRKTNKRHKIDVTYNTALPVLFGVKHYADALWPIVKERDIKVNLSRNLVAVRPDENVAVFQHLDDPSKKSEEKYSMLHVVPPMSTPNELSICSDLVNADGFVEVNKNTLQHVSFKNVFAIGDCSSSPNSKTAAAAAGQAPVVLKNVLAYLKGKELQGSYDGYASCPLLTGYDRVIMAEFDYNLEPLETFPIPQNKERYSMFLVKTHFLPAIYWHLMLPGYWNGPAFVRNALSYLKSGTSKPKAKVL